MITKGLLVAASAAAMIGATVVVTAAPTHADGEYWGAIAYSPLDGAHGTSSQQPTESDARGAAVLDCGNNGGSACEVVVTVQRPDCASLVANESLFSWGVAKDPSAARASGMDDLGESGSEVASTCGFVAGATQAPTAPPSTATTAPAPSRHPVPAPAPIPAAPTLR
ncbi:DUF4189 domain-containing protein [Mycobacterium sp. 2YAF39]|uniref:DUF4189 domain-containing protein n=1 Tax=Mycobacterium sp. 2YAF39 TaxID=3233033 RepID=UPI003F95B2DA